MTQAEEAKQRSAGLSAARCRMVAIGSSAGGLAALQTLFDHLPADLDVAFVVVTHLDPGHPSELASILSRHTRMPVAQVGSALPIEANHVYVVAPNRQLVVTDGQICTEPFEEPRGRRSPIDRSFRSLADHHGDGFAVVLSGSGSDGTIGIRAMKGTGGIVLVQDPDEAEYGSMPRSAIATGCVDVVAPVAELAAKLVELTGSERCLDDQLTDPDSAGTVSRILAYLRTETGHDFSNYKESTILRRLTRRMQINHLESIEDYLVFLRRNDKEVHALFGDFLISVTTFFRDAEAFDALAMYALTELLSKSEDNASLRIWVPGCATGEEAYSLAMLLIEERTRHGSHREIQIFATDIDAGALEAARAGLYPASIESDVNEDRLSRFFTREGDHYRIKQPLRDLVVFANHSLLRDPPFLRLDLVSCRNVLIYLEPAAQKRVFATLHSALNPGGFLFLGSAETIEDLPDAFRAVDRKNRIYQAMHRTARLPVPAGDAIPSVAAAVVRDRPRARPTGASFADIHLKALEAFAPPSVLVGADRCVQHLSESVGRFLQYPPGTPTSDIIQLVRPELKLDVSHGLHLAFDRAESSLSPPVAVQFEDTSRRVAVHAKPVKQQDGTGEALVLFIDCGPADRVDDAGTANVDGKQGDGVLLRLKEDLEFAQQRLRAGRVEFEITNEELRAANEELQSINEELQTLNAELRAKVQKLSEANANLQNLIAATEGGTLFLDAELRIKLFTPGITSQFNITVADAGRLITDFTHRLKYRGLVEDARAVLRDFAPIQREIEGTRGEWLLMRMRPYRTMDDRIDGVVITLIDITQLHRAEAALADSEARFRALVNATSYVVYRMSPDWKEMRELDGRGFIRDMTRPSTTWLDTYIDPADQPQVLEAISRAILAKGMFELEHRVKRPDGSLGWTLSRAVPLMDANGRIVEWFGAATDVTARRRAQEELAQAGRLETVGKLAGGIARDFDKLLTVIVANLELAQGIVGDGATHQLLEQAEKAAELGANFNRRLLFLTGKHQHQPQPVDLNARIADTAELLRHALGEQCVLFTRLAPALWTANVDPVELDSAILNLALNARDSMPHGGEIVFTTGNVVLDAAQAAALPGASPGDYICLGVSDNGAGMAEDVLKRATEAFFPPRGMTSAPASACSACRCSSSARAASWT